MSGPNAAGLADRSQCRLLVTTPNRPGAIAILQLVGQVEPILQAITGSDDWRIGRARFMQFGDIDEGIAVRLTNDIAQLMPHGGPRVVQRLTQRLTELGVDLGRAVEVNPAEVYPEAADNFEALMLAAIARAASPLAVDLLLDQPSRWRGFSSPPLEGRGRGVGRSMLPEEDLQRSRRLDRLIDPPLVGVVGAPNVGKSTLSNALLGRSMSITADLPGTTRDYTSGRIELAGLVVDWYDTPGLRATDDPIERKAIDLARSLIEIADLLIALADHEHDWPPLPRDPDLRVLNKIDLLPSPSGRGVGGEGNSSASRPPRRIPAHGHARTAEDLSISALHGTGLAELVTTVRDHLVPPADLQHPGPWLFDDRLLRPV